MFFSKSFGYALRGTLYVAMMSDENRKIRIDEIASRLSVPRHFLGKIMNKVAKKTILDSSKGPHGGFSLNATTLNTSILSIVEATDGLEKFDSCVLRLKKCNPEYPCPLHYLMGSYKTDLVTVLTGTNIGSLLKENIPDFIRSIAAV
jgi:Rrf2 family protein